MSEVCVWRLVAAGENGPSGPRSLVQRSGVPLVSQGMLISWLTFARLLPVVVLDARGAPLPAPLSFWQTVAAFELRMSITRHQTRSAPDSPALAGAPKVHVVTSGAR